MGVPLRGERGAEGRRRQGALTLPQSTRGIGPFTLSPGGKIPSRIKWYGARSAPGGRAGTLRGETPWSEGAGLSEAARSAESLIPEFSGIRRGPPQGG